MGDHQTELPPAWSQLTLSGLRGTLLVLGAPDVGKSTFARYLYRRLSAETPAVAYLDGDPGQSALGPPTTMTLALGLDEESGRRWHRFVGATSPRGPLRVLPVLVGAARLIQAAHEAGATTVIYDTSGLVDPAQGGAALKLAQVDPLRVQPAAVFAIQHSYELEALLVPLRRSRRTRIVDLRPAAAARPRQRTDRQAYRARQFARYFATARSLAVNWKVLAVLPAPQFLPNRLVALEDAGGFTLGLGLVRDHDPRAGLVTLFTPLRSTAGVDTLHLGDLTLDPETFRDQPLTFRA